MEKVELVSLALIFVGMLLAIFGPSFDLSNSNPMVSMVVVSGWILAIAGIIIFYSFREKARAKAKKPPIKHRFEWIDKYSEKLIFATGTLLLLFTIVVFIFALFWNLGSQTYEDWMHIPLLIFGFLIVVSIYLSPVLFFIQIYLIERHAENHNREKVFWGLFALLFPMFAGIAYIQTFQKEKPTALKH